MLRFLLATLALAACSVRADWSQGFRCEDGVCPAGEMCIDGFCRIDAFDAPAPDAPAGAPDATVIPDAPPPDAGPPDATPLPPNLLQNGDLELGLAHWYEYQSIASVSTNTPHGGLQSIKFCKDATAPTDYMSGFTHAVTDGLVPQGARYVASVWVRASFLPEDLPPPILYATLREEGGASPYRDENSVAVTTLTTEWIQLDVELTVLEADRSYVTLIVWPSSNTVPDGTCYVVDDAYVYQAP